MNEKSNRTGLLAALTAGLFGLPLFAPAHAASAPIRIGIIGTGHVGSALATHWAEAGHELVISSRHPEELVDLADSLGPKVRVGTPREAAAFGTVVLVSVPYAALPQIGKDYADELAGKVVLDTSNPVENRDGQMAVEAKRKGSGMASAEFLPNTRLVRAFNCIPAASIANDADRKRGGRIAIPIAGDDPAAVLTAKQLVRDAGFDPVLVGPLETAKLFDLGGPLARSLHNADELSKMAEQLRSN
jgi:predicted dinucleotide-binding enzyme